MPERPIAQDDNFEPDQDQKGRTVSQASIAFDWRDYADMFDDSDDLTEEQKREFIETLWHIMVSFVDLGFGIEATQLVLAAQFKAEALDTRETKTALKITTRKGGL